MCDTEATEGMEPCLVDAYCFQNRIKQTVSQVRVAERLACRRCKYQARSAVTDKGYQFGSHIGMHIHDSVRIVSLEAIGESATGSLLRYRDRCSIVRNVLDGQPQQLTETKASRCYQENSMRSCPSALAIISGTCSAVNDGLCWFFTSGRSINSWFHFRG